MRNSRGEMDLSRGATSAPPPRIEQVALASNPAPDVQHALIAPAPESAADVSAREPDTLVSDAAKERWSSRADNPDVPEPDEGICIVLDHGHDPPLESAPGTRGRGEAPRDVAALQGCERAQAERTGPATRAQPATRTMNRMAKRPASRRSTISRARRHLRTAVPARIEPDSARRTGDTATYYQLTELWGFGWRHRPNSSCS